MSPDSKALPGPIVCHEESCRSMPGFVHLGDPPVEGITSSRALDADTWNGMVVIGLFRCLVDKVAYRTDALGIGINTAIINAANSGLIECAHAHWARLTAAIDHTSLEFDTALVIAGTTNGIDHGMSSGVILKTNRITCCSDYFAILDDYCAKGGTALSNIFTSQPASHFHEMFILIGDSYLVVLNHS